MNQEKNQERETRTNRKIPVVISLDSASLRKTLVIVFVGLILFQITEWGFRSLSTFLFDLLLAWLLSISLEPIVDKLTQKGWKRGLASAAVGTSVIVAVLMLTLILGRALIEQIGELILNIPNLISSAVDWSNTTLNTNLDSEHVLSSFSTEEITGVASTFAGGVFVIFTGITSFIFHALAVLMFAFYFSASKPNIERFIASWLKPKYQMVFIDVADISVQKAGGFVMSKLVLSAFSTATHTLFFWWIGVPYWLPMGIFAGITSQFIPAIGTYLGIIIPSLFVVFDSPITVLWIVIFATIYQQIENYILTPKIANTVMKLNSGIALASVFVGVALFGPIGGLIGIPLAAIVMAVIQTYGRRYELHPEIYARVTSPEETPEESEA